MGQKKLANNVPSASNGPLFTEGGKPGPGRPKGSKGVAQRIRELTQDGQEIVEFFYNTMKDPKTTKKDRAKCAEWLGDRVFGKAPNVELTGSLTDSERSQAAAALADSELEAMARVLKEQNNPTATVVPLLASAPKSPELLKKPTD